MINNKAYVGTGTAAQEIKQKINMKQDFYTYNSVNNSCVKIKDFIGGPRERAVAFVVNNQAYVGTGFGADQNPTQKFYNYNLGPNLWKEIAYVPGEPRGRAIAFSIVEEE